jgi:uncharacterized protein with PhoU and TrkA domain
MDQLDEMLLELKDSSELMIDLAYSSCCTTTGDRRGGRPDGGDAG